MEKGIFLKNGARVKQFLITACIPLIPASLVCGIQQKDIFFKVSCYII
jgi:hypothetical protein